MINSDFILKHPLFKNLSKDQAIILRELFQLKTFKAKQLIVSQDDLVDSIYCIIEGTAEVIKTVLKDNTQQHFVITKLNPGDFIGLDDNDFYSSTGKRTATVKAITTVTTLRMDLATFYNYLLNIPYIENNMLNKAELFNRMNLIKQAAPFTSLLSEDIRKLADKIHVIKRKKGDILFNKGDLGNNCYLIQTGEIEIFQPKGNGSEQQLAILQSPQIFGEAAILLETTRNASARVLKDASLLELSNEVLFTAIKKEKNVSLEFLKLLKSRTAK